MAVRRGAHSDCFHARLFGSGPSASCLPLISCYTHILLALAGVVLPKWQVFPRTGAPHLSSLQFKCFFRDLVHVSPQANLDSFSSAPTRVPTTTLCVHEKLISRWAVIAAVHLLPPTGHSVGSGPGVSVFTASAWPRAWHLQRAVRRYSVLE